MHWSRVVRALALVLVAGCGDGLTPPVPGAGGSEGAEPLPDGTSGPAPGAAGAGDDSFEPLPDHGNYASFGGAAGASSSSGGTATTPHGGSSGAATAGASASGGSAMNAGEGGAAGEPSSEPPPPAVPPFITEYVEGSGSNKALELYAPEATSLEGCELRTYYNGKTEPTPLALHGVVAAGDTYVLCSSALAKLVPASCDRSTSLTFNGDDALALACGGVVLDVFGQIGVDPGDAWQAVTADRTLRRSCTVTSGDADGTNDFLPLEEWTESPTDDFSDLGHRSCP